MNSISSRAFTFMSGAAVVLCGLKPALIAHVVLTIGFLLCFMWRDEHGKFMSANAVTSVLIGLLLGWAAASLQWSLLPARGMYDLIILILLAVIAQQIPAGIRLMDSAAVEKLIKIIVALSGLALLIYAMDAALNLIWQRTLDGMPWEREVYMSNISRQSFCVSLLLWFVIDYGWRRGWRMLCAGLWLAVGAALLMSDSAAGRLAFGISTVVFLIAQFSPKFIRIVFAASLITGILIAVPLANQLEGSLSAMHKKIPPSFLHRTEIWNFTADRILEKPITGWGFDSARAISNNGQVSKYQHYNPVKHIIPLHPHNWLLHVLLELGIVGAVILSALWLWWLRQTETLHRAVQPLALAYFSVAMVVGAFSIGLWQHWWIAVLVFSSILVQLSHHEAHCTRQ